ncbi:substrate-binding domain-containing protein [Paraburkholderia sp. J8-2]|uniref:molybdate ABC transporter substrate-binding protein n=1 Tax=Paraburkholderia sp. J8-2 TaxID=2805440 RepID=UPI002AB6722F|nr:substrate-binding domain-containing protein [Paraburkholderia sp. J8-2]
MKVHAKRVVLGVVASLAYFIAATGSVDAAEIHVLATGALSAAMKTIIPAYEKQSGNHVDVVWGPSYGTSPDALPSRIQNGEPVDLVLMIGAALDRQIELGRFEGASKVDIAASAIGVAVRADVPVPRITTVDDLRSTLLAARSVAFSEGASGTYIVNTLFSRLGIADRMRTKSVLIEGKELVGTALERGDADLGFQQISELKAIAGIKYVGPLPAEVQQENPISAAIAISSKEKDAAETLIAFLQTRSSVVAFRHAGLVVNTEK